MLCYSYVRCEFNCECVYIFLAPFHIDHPDPASAPRLAPLGHVRFDRVREIGGDLSHPDFRVQNPGANIITRCAGTKSHTTDESWHRIECHIFTI
jgi:hypothetical protein